MIEIIAHFILSFSNDDQVDPEEDQWYKEYLTDRFGLTTISGSGP